MKKVIEAAENLVTALKKMAKESPESTRFKKLPDGWIKDSKTGLEWGPSSAKKMNWASAKEYCEKAGYRLPERFELESIIDLTKYNPAVDTKFFGDTKTDDWYWSATEVAGGSGNAWIVGFSYGDVGYCSKGFSVFVRPVRSSQCLII